MRLSMKMDAIIKRYIRGQLGIRKRPNTGSAFAKCVKAELGNKNILGQTQHGTRVLFGTALQQCGAKVRPAENIKGKEKRVFHKSKTIYGKYWGQTVVETKHPPYEYLTQEQLRKIEAQKQRK